MCPHSCSSFSSAWMRCKVLFTSPPPSLSPEPEEGKEEEDEKGEKEMRDDAVAVEKLSKGKTEDDAAPAPPTGCMRAEGRADLREETREEAGAEGAGGRELRGGEATAAAVGVAGGISAVRGEAAAVEAEWVGEGTDRTCAEGESGVEIARVVF